MTALLIGGGQTQADAPGRLARAEAMALSLSQRVATLGVLVMLGIGVLTALDVLVLRALFNMPIKGSNEFLSTIFAVAVAAVLAGGLASKTTLEIDLLARWLSARTVARLRAFGAALYLIVLAGVACCVADQAWVAWKSHSQTMLLQWPLWPFYTVIALLFAGCVPVQWLGFWRAARDLPLTEGQDSIDVVPTAPAGALMSAPIGLVAPAAAPGVVGAGSSARAAMMLVAATALAAGIWWLVQAAQPVIAAHAVAWAVGLFSLLWIVAALFVPIAAALAICGLVGMAGLMGAPQALTVLGSETIGLITQADLAVVPLFLMMGGFAVAGGLAQDIYRLAHALFAPLRGGLAFATIGGCAGFGAVTGSSLATIA
ncbi:MAG TPA: TRAP transporter large permease subunit, partial [Burkholderiaceae bacterium]|nr:TRAP transporter large permease subunit [Burkholderiaceae bacterium]